MSLRGMLCLLAVAELIAMGSKLQAADQVLAAVPAQRLRARSVGRSSDLPAAASDGGGATQNADARQSVAGAPNSMAREATPQQPSVKAYSLLEREVMAKARLHDLVSPARLEDITERLWEVEDATDSSLRTRFSMNLVYGFAHRTKVGWHQLFGPSLALRIMPFGTSTWNVKELDRRFELLADHHMNRFRWLLAYECSEAAKEIVRLRAQIVQVRADLGVPVPVEQATTSQVEQAPNDDDNAEGALFCPAPPGYDREGDPLLKKSPSPDTSAASPDTPAENPDDQRRRDFLRELDGDLIRQLEVARANFQFLQSTDERATTLFEHTQQLVSNTRRPFIFIEGQAGYAFQVSQGGVTDDLGGFMLGLGLGLIVQNNPYVPTVCIGGLYAHPSTWGLYAALSVGILK